MKVINCRVNHLVNPIGYRITTPVFSYVAEDAQGRHQSAAQITIYSDPGLSAVVADTGMRDDLNSLSCPVPVPLSPCTRYYWTARVRSDAGEEAVSDVQYFETGKMGQPWSAKWIGCDDDNPRHPVFSRSIQSEGLASGKELLAARLYICGLGLYRACIDGTPVSQERLTPYCNNYHRWIQYQTYDVSALVKDGSELRVQLGSGWYSGRFGFSSKPGDKGFYGSGWKLIAELSLQFADGTSEIIGTDGSWRVERSNITFSGIYDGEHRDDTLPPAPQETVRVLGSAEELSSELPLSERMSIPVLAHEEIHPVALLDTPAGEKVFDLGQNFAGSFRLRVHEPAGAKIRVQVGEILQQGNFYRDNLRTALAEYLYVSDGEEHVLEPAFTFYGYRYAKVEGVTDLTPDSFTGIALYSDVTPAGSLVTGAPVINQLLSNIQWGQKGNFIDVPTDCPQRDERMGWTADTQVFVPTASFFTDSAAFYRKFLFDMRQEQKDTEGKVPDVIPSFGMYGTGSSVWGDAATIIPWTLYLFTGDTTILSECMESMKAWVDWVTRTDGNDRGYGRNFHFGDWLALDNPSGRIDEVKGGTEDAFVAYVYYYNSARIVEQSAAILHLPEDEAKYHALAEDLYRYIQDEYFTKNGRLAIDTQTACVLALYYSLTNFRARPLSRLLHLLAIRKNKFVTGFVGTPLLPKVLSAEGEDHLAYDLLFNEEYPGWIYEIRLGATTVWERWNSMNPDGSVSSTGMNSFNHYAYGSIGEWMWRTIAGINPLPDAPGFKKVLLRPVADSRLQHADAVYHSASGTYRVSWAYEDETHIRLKVTVPFDCEAELVLPQATDQETYHLEAGEFELLYEAAAPVHDTPVSEGPFWEN